MIRRPCLRRGRETLTMHLSHKLCKRHQDRRHFLSVSRGHKGFRALARHRCFQIQGFQWSQTLASWIGNRFSLQWGPASAPRLLWQSTTNWVAKPPKHVVQNSEGLEAWSQCVDLVGSLWVISWRISYTAVSMVDLPESWVFFGFSGGIGVKNPPAHAGDARDLGLIPGSRRSFGVGNGNPLLCSCLENSKDSGAWWATVHGVTRRLTQLRTHTQHLVLLSLWSHNSSPHSDVLRPPHQRPGSPHISD